MTFRRRRLPEPETRNSIKKSFAFRRGLIGWKQNSFAFIANRLKPPARPRCNKQSLENSLLSRLSGKRGNTSALSANVKLNQSVHNIQLKPIYWRDSVRCLMFVLDTTSLSGPIAYLAATLSRARDYSELVSTSNASILFINRN